MHCFHFFSKFWHCFQFSEICRCMKHVFYSHNTSTRHFNNKKMLFLFQMTKHAPTFLCFQCFVPFFCIEHGCFKINLPNMAVYQQKNAKHVFSCTWHMFAVFTRETCPVLWAVSVSTYSMDIGHVAYKWILLTVSSFLCESFWFPILGDCALTDPLFSPHSGQVTVTFWPRFHRTVTGSDRRNFKCWNLEP